MSRRKIKAGSTSVRLPIFIQDSSSTTGAGLGSLVYNTAGLAAKYRRSGDSSWTTITLVTATAGTYTSGGFVADGGPVTGGYEIGIPDAVLASGATWAQLQIYGATNMLSVPVEFELDAVDYQDTVRFGLTALPNVASGSAGGLIVQGTGTTGLDVSSGKVLLQATQTGVTIPNVTNVGTLTTYTGNTPQTGDAYARLGAPAGASVSADVASIKTDTGNLVSRITSTLFSGITQLSKWLGALAGKTADASTLAEINATTAGATYSNATDSLEALRDRGDIAWLTATSVSIGAGGISSSSFQADSITASAVAADAVAEIQSGLMLASSYTAPDNAGIAAIKTKTDFLPSATAGAASGLAIVGSEMGLSAGAIIASTISNGALNGKGDWNTIAPDNASVTAIKTKTDFLPSANAGAAGGVAIVGSLMGLSDGAVTAAKIAASALNGKGDWNTVAPDNSSITAIKAKTDNLPADPAANSNLITEAGVRSAVGLASANLDLQLSALDTEVASLNNVSLAEIQTVVDAHVLSTSEKQSIANYVLRRGMAAVESAGEGDTLGVNSIYGMIQQAQDSVVVGTTMTIYKTDGATVLGTKALTTSPSAEPITGIS